MLRARFFDFSLFIISLAIAVGSERVMTENNIYVIALLIYWSFSSLYYRLRIVYKSGNTIFDYGISYSLSFAIFTGPLGLFIFETLYRFTVYFTKKRTKTADPGEFLDTVYNIGSFVLSNSIAYYLFQQFNLSFQSIPFGFGILIFLLVIITMLLLSLFLATVLFISGDIKTLREVGLFIIKSRNLLDIGKVAITNGLLLLFLQEGKWEMLISLFILNYLVSQSIVSKAHNLQNKIERDKFEQMAYTDFLTGIFNRAYMDKKMTELNQSEEYIGIVVADIDTFKSINDTYNHAVGDRVIQHFAETLKGYLTTADSLFRSGGEEFTIFLRHRNFKESRTLIEQIQKDVADNKVVVEFNNKKTNISYTSSFGLYYFKVNQNIPMEKGYVYADHLLLESKQLGRNRVSVKDGLTTEDSK